MTTNFADYFLLRKGLTFLNHGSFGSCPKPVFQNYQDWQLRLEQQPVAFLDQERDLINNLSKPRHMLAQEFNTSAQNLVRVTNATTGLNAIARSIALTEGDEILTTDHEYAAVENTWEFLVRKVGAKIVRAQVTMPLLSADQFNEDLVSQMNERTKILLLSHITSPTALLFPIKRVIDEARRRGIITVIDGAHAPGLIDLDLDELGADFYVGNCHKWLLAPKGAGFLWARPDWHQKLEPLVISHGWNVKDRKEDRTAFLDGFEIQGTQDPSAWLAVPAALEFRETHHWDEVSAVCNQRAQEFAKRVTEFTQMEPLSSPQFCAPQMVAMPMPKSDPKALKSFLLNERNIEIPVFDWKGTTIVRVSVAAYNSADDLNNLLEALRDYFK
ncbi:aminotransferase class V-fold PLP-dependent enzyme [uncultured Maritalea sp.]|uniref:aminotransferase class V-fold PLP-dependent enzyme n=1 Tax=uncultured Maritalea sp. TaxID=757249 RepID=UPI002616E2FC|nr:aminotransferase class V-fold PLP-dependent enzyme [uncultured Maritalea sp.]